MNSVLSLLELHTVHGCGQVLLLSTPSVKLKRINTQKSMIHVQS